MSKEEPKPFVKIRDICMEFDGKEVLKNVSVDIERRRAVGAAWTEWFGEIRFASHAAGHRGLRTYFGGDNFQGGDVPFMREGRGAKQSRRDMQ